MREKDMLELLRKTGRNARPLPLIETTSAIYISLAAQISFVLPCHHPQNARTKRQTSCPPHFLPQSYLKPLRHLHRHHSLRPPSPPQLLPHTIYIPNLLKPKSLYRPFHLPLLMAPPSHFPAPHLRLLLPTRHLFPPLNLYSLRNPALNFWIATCPPLPLKTYPCVGSACLLVFPGTTDVFCFVQGFDYASAYREC
ncbi:hypothetical protein K435DRAFT_418657 [Dendrothele bispora CBS 962.96]|uniref:Uncharacterized protein n=1 Tax=Dendrothele bispora (strain CBS 962.96) TaxID=1314807 RepID=A0A4S8MWC1_DENBC|nr:hypothetical protein K435DRAFT_418657 [Dendrothele bispora CBS 962.96]